MDSSGGSGDDEVFFVSFAVVVVAVAVIQLFHSWLNFVEKCVEGCGLSPLLLCALLQLFFVFQCASRFENALASECYRTVCDVWNGARGCENPDYWYDMWLA